MTKSDGVTPRNTGSLPVVSQFEQKHVMPTEVGIHFETEKAMFGFPLEFIPCFIRDENDKLRHWLPSVVFPCLF